MLRCDKKNICLICCYYFCRLCSRCSCCSRTASALCLLATVFAHHSLCHRHGCTHTLASHTVRCCFCWWSYQQMRQEPLMLENATAAVAAIPHAPRLHFTHIHTHYACALLAVPHAIQIFHISFFSTSLSSPVHFSIFTFQCVQFSCSALQFQIVVFSAFHLSLPFPFLPHISSHLFVYFEIVYYVLQNMKYTACTRNRFIYLFISVFFCIFRTVRIIASHFYHSLCRNCFADALSG